MSARSETLAFYQAQIDLARDRIRIFETGALSTGDVGPAPVDRTRDAIELERWMIANLQRALAILDSSGAAPQSGSAAA
jgi:hypothetical protein